MVEIMSNKGRFFVVLDTLLYFDISAKRYELKNFQKETKSDNMINFSSSVLLTVKKEF